MSQALAQHSANPPGSHADRTLPALFGYPKYWAECLTPAEFLPMSRAEMEQLGWDSCDVIIVTGDAYVDHPSFGMAVIGRTLEAQGFRVGIISQPDWTDPESLRVLGEPNLYFGVTAGNMDSMINRYTADRRIRHDDAYTAGDTGGKRPDYALTVYSQLCKRAYPNSVVVAGGIEASLRRLAHYDYWSDKVKRSVLMDSTADLLLFGNAERALIDLTHRLAAGEPVREIRDLRGTAFLCRTIPEGWREIDSTRIDQPGSLPKHKNPYDAPHPSDCDDAKSQHAAVDAGHSAAPAQSTQLVNLVPDTQAIETDPSSTYIRMPSFDAVTKDPALYAHADRIFHRETNPGNARPLVQNQGKNDIWINPPPLPLETAELDWVFEQPYKRVPHPSYGDAKIPAYEMIRFSVNIMRGCFGGCTFCSITEHEGRIIQSRSEQSILDEVEKIRDLTPGFTGVISDLGGPTANMYRLNCKDKKIEESCRRPSCVYPTICVNLETDHSHTTALYRKTRALKGVKKVVVASGLRYDLAVRDPEYVKELVTHHVGGYLKIAPEHSEEETLAKMMKPGMGSYYEFKEMFERFSQQAGKKQYLIPYFISGHPGSGDKEMLALALWLKQNDFRVDQVQNFYPSPMASATTMYHTERNPLRPLNRNNTERVLTARSPEQRTLHKALLRYHDTDNWPLLRKALRRMGRQDLIGAEKGCLVPLESRRERELYQREQRKKQPASRLKKSRASQRSSRGRR